MLKSIKTESQALNTLMILYSYELLKEEHVESVKTLIQKPENQSLVLAMLGFEVETFVLKRLDFLKRMTKKFFIRPKKAKVIKKCTC